jgi:5,10-methylenetetrahydromethanopterin reductase
MKFGLRIPACREATAVANAVVKAEQDGFDYAWIPDSQLLWRDPWVTLGVAAPRTERIVLGTNVTNPVTRHATVTASAAAAVEEMCPGRFVLGIGTGDSSVRVMGWRTAKIKELEEYVRTVRDLVAGNWISPYGKSIRLKGSLGRQLPVYISATGPNMLRFAGRVADGVILLAGISPDTLRFSLERIAEGATEVGRDPTSVDIATGLFFRLTDGSSEARKAAQPYAALYAMRYRDSLPDFAGVIPDAEMASQVYPDIGHAENWDQAIEMTEWLPSEILDLFVEKYCIMGTASDVLKRVQQLAGLGVNHLYIRAFSSYELPIVEGETFARAVIPAFRNEFERTGS